MAKLSAEHGAQITVPLNQVGPLRKVSLEGPAEACSRAAQLIHHLINNELAQKNLPPVDFGNHQALLACEAQLASSFGKGGGPGGPGGMHHGGGPMEKGGFESKGGKGKGGKVGGHQVLYPTEGTEWLTCPAEHVGLLIGRQGETINKIKRETGCEIEVGLGPDCDVSMRAIQIMGGPDNIIRAKALCQELLDDAAARGREFFPSKRGGRGG